MWRVEHLFLYTYMYILHHCIWMEHPHSPPIEGCTDWGMHTHRCVFIWHSNDAMTSRVHSDLFWNKMAVYLANIMVSIMYSTEKVWELFNLQVHRLAMIWRSLDGCHQVSVLNVGGVAHDVGIAHYGVHNFLKNDNHLNFINLNSYYLLTF